MVFIDLMVKLGTLAALCLVSGIINRCRHRDSRFAAVAQGVLFGSVAVLGMYRPLDLGPGLIFDGCSIIISLCALFFGPWAAGMACVLAVMGQVGLDGSGMLSGTLILIASATIGVVAHNRHQAEEGAPSIRYLYLFGIAVHVAMLAVLLTLAGHSGAMAFKRVGWLVVLLLYPPLTVLVGRILCDQLAVKGSEAVDVPLQKDEERRMQRLMQMRVDLLEYGEDHSAQELLTKVLDDTATLLESPIGFYHYLGADRQSINKRHYSTHTPDAFCRFDGGGPSAILQECIRCRQPVVRNASDSPLSLQPPSDGGVAITRGLVVPIVRGAEMVALMGVADGATDYSQSDIRAVAYLGDVTWHILEKKAGDEALRESESLFRNIFEHHLAVKLIIDPDTGAIIDANRAAETFYGWPKSQLKKMTIQEINTLPPEEVKAAMRRAGTSKKAHFSFQHRLASGAIKDVRVFSSRIEMNGTELLHSIILDVTEEKAFERRLKESEGRYRDLFEYAPIGIFSTSSQGRVLSVNFAMARILGFADPKDVIRYYSNLKEKLYVNAEQRDHFLKILRKEGQVQNYEYQGRMADGRRIWISMNARIARQHENGEFVIEGFCKDITSHRKLEDQLRQAQKMESVGRLAGGVAHDYNNMLGVILGFTELALDQVEVDSPIRDNLQQILKAVNRSSEVTRQLLAFARKQTIDPRVIDLNRTVEGMSKMLVRLIGEDIQLVWHPKPGLWPVKMDPSQIDQILANLCVNARDAIGGAPGKITIETDMVELDQLYCNDHEGFVPGIYVLLAVTDSGCGMDKETLGKVFEPFFTTKSVGKGTGLGMAMVYGIVKQNNGFINVYSEPGKGSVIKIYLPRVGEDVTETREATGSEYPLGRGETVLVVEDEEAILGLCKAILEKSGYVAWTACTAREALQIAKTPGNKIDLLISDVVLPELNGRDLAKHLKSLQPEMKCLFMSGYTAETIAHHGVLDDTVCFIQKPFSRQGLAAKVREALEKSCI